MQHPIKVKRDALNLSLADLADHTKISASMLNRLERCERRLTTGYLRILAKALRCTEQDLIPTEAQELAICQARQGRGTMIDEEPTEETASHV